MALSNSETCQEIQNGGLKQQWNNRLVIQNDGLSNCETVIK